MDLTNLLIPYKDFNGEWDLFINYIYSIFERDFIIEMPYFKGNYVDFYDKRKINSQKEETFWHLTTKIYKYTYRNATIKERKPDIKRAERIAWIKEIIENYCDPSVLIWLDKSFPKAGRYHLWYNNEFLVVMADLDRNKYYNLITAFCTDEQKKIQKLKQEYAKWNI